MKKCLLLLISIVLIVSCFSGCKSKEEKTTTTVSLKQQNKEKGEKILNKLKTAQKGDVVEFGNSLMSWKVLRRKGDELLLLLDKATMPAEYSKALYNQIKDGSDEIPRDMYYNTIEAFNDRDAFSFYQNGISNHQPMMCRRIPGTGTVWTDLAVWQDVREDDDSTYLFYLGEDRAKKYCTKEDLILRDEKDDNKSYEWWLGAGEYVDKNGNIKELNYKDDYEYERIRKAIRPALWVDTSVEIEEDDLDYNSNNDEIDEY